MTTEQKKLDWLEEEESSFTQQAEYEQLPSLKLTPNVIAELTIDFSKKFEKWNGENSGKKVTKAIIPVTLQGQKLLWWLNVKNPVYREIIIAGKNGATQFKVMQIGTQQNTKYVIIK